MPGACLQHVPLLHSSSAPPAPPTPKRASPALSSLLLHQDLRDSNCVGRKMGWGVKLLGRGAEAFAAPVHLQASGGLGWAGKRPPAGAGAPLCRLRCCGACCLQHAVRAARCNCRSPVARLLPPRRPRCPPAGQPGERKRARGDRGGGRQRDHSVLQPAGPARAAQGAARRCCCRRSRSCCCCLCSLRCVLPLHAGTHGYTAASHHVLHTTPTRMPPAARLVCRQGPPAAAPRAPASQAGGPV